MTLSKLRYHLLVCFLCFFALVTTSSARTDAARPVSGCELLRHPSRYNGNLVIVTGRYMAGFERSDLTFDCPGSVGIRVSLSPPDLKKYGFVTDPSTIDAMSQLPLGEHPGDNLTTRKLRYAPVTVTGLFRCHYDFQTCKNASRDEGSIVVKSMKFNAPMSEVSPAAKLGEPSDNRIRPGKCIADASIVGG